MDSITCKNVYLSLKSARTSNRVLPPSIPETRFVLGVQGNPVHVHVLSGNQNLARKRVSSCQYERETLGSPHELSGLPSRQRILHVARVVLPVVELQSACKIDNVSVSTKLGLSGFSKHTREPYVYASVSASAHGGVRNWGI